MEPIKKKRILQDNALINSFSIEKLDQYVAQGDISIEEFKQYNLELSKVKELERLDDLRKGIVREPEPAAAKVAQEAPAQPEASSIEDQISDFFNSLGGQLSSNPVPAKVAQESFAPPASSSVTPPSDTKLELIEKVKRGEVGIDQIKKELNNNLYTYSDLEAAGVPKRIIHAMQYYFQLRPIRSFAIEDLPPMDKGRTDLFFVGIAGSGKSVMLAGLLQYANKKGIMIPITKKGISTPPS